MPKQRQIKWKLIIRWAGTLLSVLLLVYLMLSAGLDEIIQSLEKLSFGTILSISGLIFLSRIATFARWHVLLQIDMDKVNWRDSLRLTFAGLFAANFLPTTIGGDVVRLAGAMRIGMSGSLAAASLIVDRLIGMAGMVFALPFGITPLMMLLKSEQSSLPVQIQHMGVILILQGLWKKGKASIRKVIDALSYWYRHPKYLIYALLFTFIHMLCIFLIVKIIIIDMGESLS
ncbi:flippase-like domain-containing protein, partial [bacterium]|nr:flippase-like domain-containing protein [bacterium]